jgi:hypothetical protein
VAYQRDIVATDKVFYDTDRVLRYTVYAGDPTEAEILAGTAVPVDVSGWAIGWTLRKKPGTTDPPLIHKEIGSPGGITVVGTFNADPEVNTQRVEVLLEDSDTYDPGADPALSIKPGLYSYALKRLDDGSEGILAWGTFTLLQAAAWE